MMIDENKIKEISTTIEKAKALKICNDYKVRNIDIAISYLRLKNQGKSYTECCHELGQKFFLSFNTVQGILKDTREFIEYLKQGKGK